MVLLTADGAYDQEGVAAAVATRQPEAAVIVPPRSTAVSSETAKTAPTQQDQHRQVFAEMGCQRLANSRIDELMPWCWAIADNG